MKKSELKAYIKEEIISTLSEAEEIASPKDVETQTALNAELEKTAKLRKDAGLAENEDDDVEPTAADLKKGDSIAKIATKLSANEKEMKTVVNQWKKAEGAEKEEFLKRLKALTKIKKELEGLL